MRESARLLPGKGLLSIAHTPYPTNLAAGDGDVPSREVMVKSLLNDLEIAEACGSLGIVVHFGHFHKLQPLQGYQNIIQCINETLQSWNGTVKLLIENQAGNGGFEGTSLEELVKIRELSRYPEKSDSASIPAMLLPREYGIRSAAEICWSRVIGWTIGRIWQPFISTIHGIRFPPSGTGMLRSAQAISAPKV